MRIEVEYHAGHRGEETPQCLVMADKRIAITEVLDRWLAPDYRYFKLRGENGATYILRHDTATARWELVLYDRPGRA